MLTVKYSMAAKQILLSLILVPTIMISFVETASSRQASGTSNSTQQSGGTAASRQKAAQQSAWDDMGNHFTYVFNSPAIKAVRAIHKKFENYNWRTLYQFTQISKSPLPGTRLGLQALPTMSQMDAEQFLLTGMPNLPGMNCPASHMGGAAGRPIVITVTIRNRTKSIQVSDREIKALFFKAAPNRREGQLAYDVFNDLRNSICDTIYNTAQLESRYQKYQDIKKNWNACKKDGVSLTQWEKKERFKFPGNKKRHAAVGGGILFFCGEVYKGNSSDALAYESWFKWSSNSPVPLDLIQKLKDTSNSSNSCPKACVPIVGGAGVSASICIGLDPGLPSSADAPIPLRLGAKFRAYKRNKTLCTPVINVPAPFGIAQSLQEMADKGKVNAKNKLESQLESIIPMSQGMKDKIAKLSEVF